MNFDRQNSENLERNLRAHTPRVLVLGAGGRLGSHVCRAFATAGWTVLAQARKPLLDLPRTARLIQTDVLDTETILRHCGEIDVIVHAVNPDYARWDSLLPPVTEAVLAIAARSKALLMIPGNVYNFGCQLPALLTEETPFVADNAKAQQRIAMEARFQDAARQGVRTVVIRAGDFIGGEGTWLDMAITKSLHKNVFTQMGDPHVPHAWAYLPDLATVFVRVAQHRARLAKFEVLHYPGITASAIDMQAALEGLLGRHLKVKAMPWFLFGILAWFSPLLRAVLSMRYLWQRPHQLSGDKLMRLIGPLPHTSLREMLRQYLPKSEKKSVRSSQNSSAVQSGMLGDTDNRFMVDRGRANGT